VRLCINGLRYCGSRLSQTMPKSSGFAPQLLRVRNGLFGPLRTIRTPRHSERSLMCISHCPILRSGTSRLATIACTDMAMHAMHRARRYGLLMRFDLNDLQIRFTWSTAKMSRVLRRERRSHILRGTSAAHRSRSSRAGRGARNHGCALPSRKTTDGEANKQLAARTSPTFGPRCPPSYARNLERALTLS